MIRRLLCWTLALTTLNAPLFAKGDEPVDPYSWLEDVAGSTPLAWVKERNAESTSELTRSDRFQSLNRRILETLDSEARIPAIQKLGPYYYNFWRDAKNPRGLWRRTTLEEYRKAKPNWEVVLDLDALGKEEKENWVWKGAQVLRPEFKLALISLSRGGADASVVREFDISTRSFVNDGYQLPEAKSRLSWRASDSAFVGTDFGSGSLTRSGYPRIVKEWKRGTPLSEAVVVFEGQPSDVSVSGFRDLTPGFERDFVIRSKTSWSSEYFLRRDGHLIQIEKPDDARPSVHREWLLLHLRSDWSVAGKTYPAGALIATDLEAYLKGTRKFDVLFEPTERKSLEAFGTRSTRNHLLLNELDNVRSRVTVLTHHDGRWLREPLPGISEFGHVSASGVDPEDSDDYFLTTTDFLTPSTMAIGTVGRGPAETLKQLPAFFDAKGLAISQHETVSKDGTRVPYFEVARKDLTMNGKNPTLLNGYGGFEISMLPSYRPEFGVAWLEQGGVYVLANIRGGGEFGPRWHQAALKANRPKAYEDFIAVAEDLIRRQVTSPPHLGVMGRSNGGLLVGNMLTRRPDLFGAIVCGSPLLDMKRYSHLLAGASWMGEYGNPDVPEEWTYIRTFSPYHNVEKSVHYPRTLFTTSTRDDRVHPGHARKMVAKMREQGHDVLLYENIEGGHGAAADNKQAALMDALAFSFLWKELSLASSSASAQPQARKFDDPGAPPFKVLKEGENPPLDAYDNFVIGPNYVPAPERKKVEGVPEGKVEQFVIDSKETKLFNPGIARNEFGKVDPNNPKTLIVETHPIDYKRRVGVYIPAQYKKGAEAPFMVVHDGPGQASGYKTILDNLIHQKRIPPIILISIGNGGGDAQGHERGKEYDNMNGDYAEYIETEVLPRVEKNCGVKLTKDPDGRAAMGNSSGGSAALIMAWFRDDLYHRVLTTSGTFVNQAWPFDPKYPDGAWGFHETLIPSSPKKPIRLFISVGDADLKNPNVMRDGMHDWVETNQRMAKVLKAKGYEYQYLFCRGARHSVGNAQQQFLPHAIEWVWKGYSPKTDK